MVAFSAPAGLEIEAEASGCRRRVLGEEKGRMRRVMKLGIMAAMRRRARGARRVRGEKGRLDVAWWVAEVWLFAKL